MNIASSLRGRVDANCILGLFSVALVAFIASEVALVFTASSVWDDAFMFVRYADNIMNSGTVSFNPGGEGTYGLTSIAFLVIVLPIRMLLPDSPALTMLIASSVCGFLFVGLVIALVRKWAGAKNAPLASLAIVLLLASFAMAIDRFAVHFVTGMDTLFALAFMTAYIIMSKWHEKSCSWASMILTGVLGGLAFSVRPDLMIYTALLPCISLLYARNRQARLQAFALIGVTGIVMLFQMGLYYLYLNSPLPLPFFAKGLDIYGETIHEHYRLTPWRQLYYYGHSFPLLYAVIALPFFINPRSWWRNLSPVDKGLFFATTLFIGYYLLFVLMILGTYQRFYYPTLPAFVFLFALSLVFLGQRVSLSDWYQKLVRQAFVKVVSPGVMTLIMGGLLYGITGNTLELFDGQSAERHNFDVRISYQQRYADYWFCLDKFSELPDDCSLATTEVGYPSALNPGKAVIDIAGLNETAVAHHGFSADFFFSKYQPDVIYLPHPHYEDLINQIVNAPYFLGHYEHFSSAETGTTMAVAISKDSKYYSRLRQIVESGLVTDHF